MSKLCGEKGGFIIMGFALDKEDVPANHFHHGRKHEYGRNQDGIVFPVAGCLMIRMYTCKCMEPQWACRVP